MTALALVSQSTRDICDAAEFGDDAQQAITEGRLDTDVSPGAFLDALVESERLEDALRFLAHALPKRESVWWSCQCVRAATAEADSLIGLTAGEAWVRDPHDGNRRAAMAVATDLEFATADAWSAVAAFWAEGSIAAKDEPALEAAPELTGKAVVGAVLLAVSSAPPDSLVERGREFVELGIAVSNGSNRWDTG